MSTTTTAPEQMDAFTGADDSYPADWTFLDSDTDQHSSIQGNKLRHTVDAAGSGELIDEWDFKLSGDFDVRVAVDLGTITPTGDISLMVNNGVSNAWCSLKYSYAGDTHVYQAYVASPYSSTYTADLGSGETSGIIRLVRTGTLLSFQYWNGTGWTEITSKTYGTGEVTVSLRTNFSGDAYCEYDDFEVWDGSATTTTSVTATTSTTGTTSTTAPEGAVTWIETFEDTDPKQQDHLPIGWSLIDNTEGMYTRAVSGSLYTTLPLNIPVREDIRSEIQLKDYDFGDDFNIWTWIEPNRPTEYTGMRYGLRAVSSSGVVYRVYVDLYYRSNPPYQTSNWWYIIKQDRNGVPEGNGTNVEWSSALVRLQFFRNIAGSVRGGYTNWAYSDEDLGAMTCATDDTFKIGLFIEIDDFVSQPYTLESFWGFESIFTKAPTDMLTAATTTTMTSSTTSTTTPDPYMEEDFTGTNGTLPTNWEHAVGAEAELVEIQSDKLRCTWDGATVGGACDAKFLYSLTGDFDIRVTESLNHTDADIWAGLYLRRLSGSSIGHIRLRYDASEDDHLIQTEGITSDALETGLLGAGYDTDTQLRLKRVGSMMYAYYWNGSSWVEVTEYGSYIGTEDVAVSLYMWSQSNADNQANFDDFTVQIGETGEWLGWVETTTTAPIPAWYVDAAYRLKLDIDSTKISTDLTDFPVMIKLSASCGIASYDATAVFTELGSDANRKKISVVATNEYGDKLVCPIEIVKWDHASEEAWLWVKVPSISSTADTQLHLYYDSSLDDSSHVGDIGETIAQTVWSNGFDQVLHMQDYGNDVVEDSTSNSRDGGKNATEEPANATGMIGGAQDFDASNQDKIINNDWFSQQDYDEGTIEALFKPDVIDGTVVGFVDGTLYCKAELALYSGGPYARCSLGISSCYSDPMTTGAWYYQAIHWNVTTAYIRDADAQDGTIAYTDGNGTGAEDGGIGYLSDDYFDGMIQEIRVSSVNRSADWMNATYYAMFDTFIAIAAEAPLTTTTEPPQISWTETFTGVDGTLPENWTAEWSGSVTDVDSDQQILNNELRHAIGHEGGEGYLDTVLNGVLVGDFDISVEYIHFRNDSERCLMSMHFAYDGDSKYAYIGRWEDYDSDPDYILASSTDAGSGSVDVNPNDGFFRMTRESGVMKAYYKTTGDWVLVKTFEHSIRDDLTLSLRTQAFGDVSIYGSWDNFQIEGSVYPALAFPTTSTTVPPWVYREDFTGDDGDPLPSAWEFEDLGTGGATIEIRDNALDIGVVLPGQTGPKIVRLQDYTLRGDFDVQVDFSGFVGRVTGVNLLGFRVIMGAYYQTIWRYDNNGAVNGYNCSASFEAQSPVNDWTEEDAAGKVRLVRVGDVISSYYWQVDYWYLLATFDAPPDTDAVVELGSVSARTAVHALDNFIITSVDELIFTGTSTSSTSSTSSTTSTSQTVPLPDPILHKDSVELYALGGLVVDLVEVYSLRPVLSVDLEEMYYLTDSVQNDSEESYAFLARNPLSVDSRETYVLRKSEAEMYDHTVAMVIGGEPVAAVGFTITYGKSSYCMMLSVILADEAAYKGVVKEDVMVVTLNSDEYHFILDSKSRSRQHGSTTWNVYGRSKTTKLAAPNAAQITKTWGASTAEAIIQELCDLYSIGLIWEIDDWAIPAGTVTAQEQTPLEIIRMVIGQYSEIQTSKLGELVIRHSYPVSPTQLAGETPELSLSDQDDLVSVSDYTVEKEGYNAVTVADADIMDAETENIEAELDDDYNGKTSFLITDTEVYIRVYSSEEYSLHLTAGTAEKILSDVIKELDPELLAFVHDAPVSVSKPVHQLLAVTWFGTNLGSLSVLPERPNSVAASGQTTDSIGLGEVTYSTRYDVWKIILPVGVTDVFSILTLAAHN